ncbi:MAG TPA: hypothetical protein ENI23_06415 [bacterium]|nr:hypothetical protein [bacterium]
MSELTQCNFCRLQSIKKNKPKGARVHLVQKGAWIDVYVVPKGEKLDTRQEPNTQNHLSDQWKASFLALSDHCAC